MSTACNYGVFKIKKGSHSSGFRFSLQTSNEQIFKFKFDESAIYKTQDPRNQGDINKLYGFSDCLTHHHTHSARLGWRWLNDQIEIMAYSYANKERSSKFVVAVMQGDISDAKINIKNNSEYEFTVNGHTVTLPRACDKEKVTGYTLFPYFGGDETAPHDIQIEVLKTSKNSRKISKNEFKFIKQLSFSQYK
tara:strand:+ start:673 stop:1248 length:576 start_codon:yes stop_codon:yes gene_type:complete